MTARIFSKLILSLVAVLALALIAVDYLVTQRVQHALIALAVPAAAIDAQVQAIRNEVLLSTALAFLPFVILAAVFARYISSRLGTIIEFTHQLAEGNFRARLPGSSRGVLGLLSTKLNETSEKLEFMLDRLETEHVELEKLENIRKDFVINVSHELRTPLASIQGYTETLLDGAIHDPVNNLKFLNIIRQNAERLARLTADLLTLSRVELGQQEFKFASYYVNRLLTDNLDGMRPIAERRGIQLVLEPAEPRRRRGLLRCRSRPPDPDQSSR